MSDLLSKYREIVGADIINELHQMAAALKGLKIVHVNSTKYGGGVAEILHVMTHLTAALGIETRWEVMDGSSDFFECTKGFHNALQGYRQTIPSTHLLQVYEKVTRENAEVLKPVLEDANFVFIHDPQPAALIKFFETRKNKWIWRCHIDLSNPDRFIWKYLSNYVKHYDASIFSIADFVQKLPHPLYLIPPSIDPLSEKNIELSKSELESLYSRFQLDPSRPLLVQISRFDRFKDPLGVIKAYRLVKKFKPGVQLVLAGGGAPDDPEGEAILNDVRVAVDKDPDIHILYLPLESDRTINGLQRIADIVIQKSIKEGFGLTVTEALWKKKPVVGGNSGGIRLQILNHQTGFLVNTPEGAAYRIRYLLQNPKILTEMGEKGYQYVHDNFLITRLLRDYLTLIFGLLYPDSDRIELHKMRNMKESSNENS